MLVPVKFSVRTTLIAIAVDDGAPSAAETHKMTKMFVGKPRKLFLQEVRKTQATLPANQ